MQTTTKTSTEHKQREKLKKHFEDDHLKKNYKKNTIKYNLKNIIVELWWHTVGTRQNDVQNVPKIYCSFLSMLLQNAAKPSLILYHYKSYSISLPLCSQHPLLAVNIHPLSTLISPVSYLVFCLPFFYQFSPIFHILPHMFLNIHIFVYHYIFHWLLFIHSFSFSPSSSPPGK